LLPPVAPAPVESDHRPRLSPRAAVGWLVGVALAMFAVSFLAADLIELHHDVYLLVYVTTAVGCLTWFARRSGTRWAPLLRRRPWWSLVVGIAVGGAVVGQVVAQDGTGHPSGAYFWFEVVWRGLAYGAVDALVLAVFPAAVAHLVLRGDRNGARRKLAFAGLVVLFSLVVSATYHAGYATYRGDTMARPLTGTVMWDVPAVLTGNPAGAVLAHTAVHTSAVVHQYRGGDDHLLPPELDGTYAENGGGFVGAGVAVGWLLLLLVVGVRGLRRRPGRLALAFMRLPLQAYRRGKGHLLGHTFVAFTHVGRRTGTPYQSVAMVLNEDHTIREVVVCAAWGPDTDWYRNLRADPASSVMLGRDAYVAEAIFLEDQDAIRVANGFRGRHPYRLRLMSRILGWGDLRDEKRVCAFVRTHPFVAFRPSAGPSGSRRRGG
jgi:deazaflavin-dependent oxidoreductase (nitroreductase family)